MKQLQILVGSLFILSALNASAQTPVEVKLVAAIEEDRGWCIDLRGGQNNGQPIGGLHGHTCYTYNGSVVAVPISAIGTGYAYAMSKTSFI